MTIGTCRKEQRCQGMIHLCYRLGVTVGTDGARCRAAIVNYLSEGAKLGSGESVLCHTSFCMTGNTGLPGSGFDTRSGPPVAVRAIGRVRSPGSSRMGNGLGPMAIGTHRGVGGQVPGMHVGCKILEDRVLHGELVGNTICAVTSATSLEGCRDNTTAGILMTNLAGARSRLTRCACDDGVVVSCRRRPAAVALNTAGGIRGNGTEFMLFFGPAGATAVTELVGGAF